MKNFLLIISCFLFSFNVYSQNYSTVIQGDTSYYEYYNTYYYDFQNTQLITSVYVDSTATITGGTQLFNYRRFDYLNFPFALCDSAIRTGWLGVHSLQLSNGYDVFITEKGDSVFINTQAVPGSSWTYFNFPNGNYLEATLDSISERTFIGVTDSVMNISLQTKNSGGTNITGEYDGKGLWLSKNHGLLKTFGYRYFPDDSTTYNLSGWSGNANGTQNLTTADIFNFDVGDEFHYHNYYSTSAPYHDEIFIEWHVLSKTFSANGDTIIYEMDNTYFAIHQSFTNVTYTNIHDTIPFYVRFSAITHLNGLSEQLVNTTVFFPQHYGFTLPFQDTTYFSRDRKFCEDFYEFDTSANCFMWPIGMGIFPHRTFVEGLGEVLETDNTFNQRYDSLVYYKKGAEEWGQKLNWTVILGVDDMQVTVKNVNVFPNPASDYFDIIYNGTTNKAVEFELYDLVGKQVLNHKINPDQQLRVDCKNIPNGLYFYSLTGEYGNKVTGKIVIAKE